MERLRISVRIGEQEPFTLAEGLGDEGHAMTLALKYLMANHMNILPLIVFSKMYDQWEITVSHVYIIIFPEG
jgi:hypothetical protein